MAFIVFRIGVAVFGHESLEGQQAQERLEKEFSLIQPMPGTSIQDHDSSHKARQAFVGSNYSTTLGYGDIRSYYDRELSRLGWRFKSEEKMTDWWRDFGGKEVEYCKGAYTAHLQYAGERADYRWTYALDLGWIENESC